MELAAATLLDEMGALRDKARADQHGYWLPLVLFGVLILGVPLADPGSARTAGLALWNAPGLHIGHVVIASMGILQGPTPASGTYWLAAIVVGLLATVIWYRGRANRIGVAPRISTYLWPAFGALALFTVAQPILDQVLNGFLPPFTPVTFWSDVVITVVGIGVAVLSVNGRGPAPLRWLGGVVGIVLIAVGLGGLGVFSSIMGYGGLFIIALGLIALAWMERSIQCGVIVALFLAGSLLANLYNVENIFGSSPPLPVVDALIHLVPPAAVLIIGGVVALVTGTRSRAVR